MPCSSNDILTLAKTQIGVCEKPKGSNNVIYNTEYYGREINDPNYAWCATFVWWLFKHCNAPELYYNGGKTAYVPALDDWGRKNGLTVTEPQPGDLIIFDWDTPQGGGDHVAVCLSSTPTTITTIDGNCDDAVRQVIRSRSGILRIIRPKYNTTPAGQPVCSVDSCPVLSWIREMINERGGV